MIFANWNNFFIEKMKINCVTEEIEIVVFYSSVTDES
jgi:hypothetical protein